MSNLQYIIDQTGFSSKQIKRILKELGIDYVQTLSQELLDFVCVYTSIGGQNKAKNRLKVKAHITGLINPVEEFSIDKEYKELLADQMSVKDSQLKSKDELLQKLIEGEQKKDEIIAKTMNANTNLTLQLVKLLDDISMLRIEDKGTLQRLYDKNILADLLTDLPIEGAAYKALKTTLDRLNKNN